MRRERKHELIFLLLNILDGNSPLNRSDCKTVACGEARDAAGLVLQGRVHFLMTKAVSAGAKRERKNGKGKTNFEGNGWVVEVIDEDLPLSRADNEDGEAGVHAVTSFWEIHAQDRLRLPGVPILEEEKHK